MAGAHRAGTGRTARFRPGGHALVWLACGVAAVLVTSSTAGTLGSWTSAVLANDDNEAATGSAVVLAESDGVTTCRSSDQPSNTSTCTSINKYGGTATPLMPGGSRTVEVTFTNIGSADASSFTLAPGSCSQTPTAGSGTPAATNLCTASGELSVAISCSPGATYAAGAAWTDLVYTAAAPPTATKSHTATAGELDAGAQWTCRVTVALAAGASVASQDIVVSQSITWTLAS